MDILITVLIYTLEAAISAFYFGQRFDQKRPTNILFLCYTLSAGIQMIIHSIDIIANSFISALYELKYFDSNYYKAFLEDNRLWVRKIAQKINDMG